MCKFDRSREKMGRLPTEACMNLQDIKNVYE